KFSVESWFPKQPHQGRLKDLIAQNVGAHFIEGTVQLLGLTGKQSDCLPDQDPATHRTGRLFNGCVGGFESAAMQRPESDKQQVGEQSERVRELLRRDTAHLTWSKLIPGVAEQIVNVGNRNSHHACSNFASNLSFHCATRSGSSNQYSFSSGRISCRIVSIYTFSVSTSPFPQK